MRTHQAEFITGAVDWRGMPDDGRPEVAFLGRSNVGKSSLINALLGRRALARTSNTPGRTQQFNYFLIEERFYLVDLPGFGYAKVSRVQREHWARMIADYLVRREQLDLAVYLVDSRHSPTAIDLKSFAMLAASPADTLIVLTKSDKPKQGELNRNLRETRDAIAAAGLAAEVLTVSAHGKRGLDGVWEVIASAVESRTES